MAAEDQQKDLTWSLPNMDPSNLQIFTLERYKLCDRENYHSRSRQTLKHISETFYATIPYKRRNFPDVLPYFTALRLTTECCKMLKEHQHQPAPRHLVVVWRSGTRERGTTWRPVGPLKIELSGLYGVKLWGLVSLHLAGGPGEGY